jgi:hypothetical protein
MPQARRAPRRPRRQAADRPALASPALPEPAPGDPSFRFTRAQIARLRPADRALLRQTLRRLGELDSEHGRAIVARATEALRLRVGHPPAAAEDQRAFLTALLYASRAG